MEVKPITILAQPGGKPVSAGHFCTVRLSKPNKQGAITVEIVPSRRVAKKVARTSGRYLLSQPPTEKVDNR